MSKSSAQVAVNWLLRRKLLVVSKDSVTATPSYSVQRPWRDRARSAAATLMSPVVARQRALLLTNPHPRFKGEVPVAGPTDIASSLRSSLRRLLYLPTAYGRYEFLPPTRTSLRGPAVGFHRGESVCTPPWAELPRRPCVRSKPSCSISRSCCVSILAVIPRRDRLSSAWRRILPRTRCATIQYLPRAADVPQGVFARALADRFALELPHTTFSRYPTG